MSVVVPTFNRARLLQDAVASVLGQSHGDWELVVVDDGSTDDTRHVVEPFLEDGRVRYCFHANRGLAATRNRGVAEATGDLLAFLDSDDCYPHDALERHLAVLEANPATGMTVGGYDYMDVDGQSLGQRRPWEEGGKTDLAGWLFNCYTMPGGVMLWRSWFDRVGGFDAELEVLEDWDLFLRLAVLKCPMSWVQASVCRYRIHADTLSSRWLAQRDTALKILDRLVVEAGGPGGSAVSAEMLRRAKGWVYVGLAKRQFETGQVAPAQEALRSALCMDACLSGTRKAILLEALLAPSPQRAAMHKTAEVGGLSYLPSELNVGPGDLRKAKARLAMAHFFTAVGRSDHAAAARHLKDALLMDARWAMNRGVMAFMVRSAVRWVWGTATGLGKRPA